MLQRWWRAAAACRCVKQYHVRLSHTSLLIGRTVLLVTSEMWIISSSWSDDMSTAGAAERTGCTEILDVLQACDACWRIAKTLREPSPSSHLACRRRCCRPLQGGSVGPATPSAAPPTLAGWPCW